jgi:hypothetical protein
MSTTNFVRTSISWPREYYDIVEASRPRYKRRSEYLLELALEHINETKNNQTKSVQGPKGSSPMAQAPPRTPTPTSPTNAGTLEVDRLSNMATTEGNRRIGGNADVNEQDPNSSF